MRYKPEGANEWMKFKINEWSSSKTQTCKKREQIENENTMKASQAVIVEWVKKKMFLIITVCQSKGPLFCNPFIPRIEDYSDAQVQISGLPHWALKNSIFSTVSSSKHFIICFLFSSMQRSSQRGVQCPAQGHWYMAGLWIDPPTFWLEDNLHYPQSHGLPECYNTTAGTFKSWGFSVGTNQQKKQNEKHLCFFSAVAP